MTNNIFYIKNILFIYMFYLPKLSEFASPN